MSWWQRAIAVAVLALAGSGCGLGQGASPRVMPATRQSDRLVMAIYEPFYKRYEAAIDEWRSEMGDPMTAPPEYRDVTRLLATPCETKGNGGALEPEDVRLLTDALGPHLEAHGSNADAFLTDLAETNRKILELGCK